MKNISPLPNSDTSTQRKKKRGDAKPHNFVFRRVVAGTQEGRPKFYRSAAGRMRHWPFAGRKARLMTSFLPFLTAAIQLSDHQRSSTSRVTVMISAHGWAPLQTTTLANLVQRLKRSPRR